MQAINLNADRWDMLTVNHEPSAFDFTNADLTDICDSYTNDEEQDAPWNYNELAGVQ